MASNTLFDTVWDHCLLNSKQRWHCFVYQEIPELEEGKSPIRLPVISFGKRLQGRLLQRHHSFANCVAGKVGEIVNVELVHQVRAVRFDRLGT
jgi:hypothetical protein